MQVKNKIINDGSEVFSFINYLIKYRFTLKGKCLKICFPLFLIIVLITSCKKLVNVDAPVTSINAANVYTTDAQAASVLTGIYTEMSTIESLFTGTNSISLLLGLSADELSLYSGVTSSQLYYYENALSTDAAGYEIWQNLYPYIFACNSSIEGLNSSTGLTPSVKQQLLGEAKFMRAFFYFYLVNLYGDVPLVLSSDYKINSVLPRSDKTKVYQQIISDLKEAQALLTTGYLKGDIINSTTERVRPNKWAATALLARTYLYTGDWVNAEAQSTAVINNSTLYKLTTLNNAFLENSNEAIWQLQPVNDTYTNTYDAYIFIIPSTGLNATNLVQLSSSFLNTFETGDQRRVVWVDSVDVDNTTYFYPFKYKVNTLSAPVTEYLMVLRLGEQYLIRAEARAQQGNSSGATSDLNTIRARASLPNITATTQSDLLTAIWHERQIELFSEWGHRWLDLKRTGRVNTVMSIVSSQKGGSWNANQQLYPIPVGDIQRDPNLVQNPGF